MLMLSVFEWLFPISIGLLVGVLFATRKNHDYSQLIVLSAEEFRQNMRKGQLIDVRTKEEFEQKKINGSRNFPKRSLSQDLYKLRRDQSVFIVSNQIGQMRQVGKKLIKKGYKPVYLLKDGLDAWPYSFKE